MVIELKILTMKKVLEIFHLAGDQIVHGNHVKPFVDEAITQMGPKEPSSSGD